MLFISVQIYGQEYPKKQYLITTQHQYNEAYHLVEDEHGRYWVFSESGVGFTDRYVLDRENGLRVLRDISLAYVIFGAKNQRHLSEKIDQVQIVNRTDNNETIGMYYEDYGFAPIIR
jgi:hypothetical protein